jgi:Flp pilus assembly secretin CpaC
MARSLSRLESCEIFFAGPGVVLRGVIEDEREAGRIWALAHAFPKELLDETELSEAVLQRGKASLEGALKSIGKGAALRLEQLGASLWVRGSVEKPTDLASIEKRLRAAFAPVELELDALPDGGPTVHFKVFLLELRKSRIGNFGLTWPSLQEGAFKVTTGAIQDLVQLDLTLQMLEGEGSVHVLSNPELVVRAPGEAQLFAGGELPISMKTHYYQNVTWKNYGLTLKLKVTGSTAEKVRLDVFTEVSRLDPAITMDQVPALQTNRMNTTVDARYGTPLFLSGLLQQGTRESARGLPLLRQIPVLGALFGSEDYLNDRSELVAILLPRLEPPTAPMARIEAERRKHAEFWGETLPDPEPELPPASSPMPQPSPQATIPHPPWWLLR